jgi:HK97 family phage prohead protease
MNDKFEYRAYEMMDVKVNKDQRVIEGRAVVYNTMSNTLRTTTGTEFREIIKPGALRESMDKNDVLAFKEHNPAYLLGRKSAGTLMMEDRADGLYVRISIPETSYGDDTLISAARGDLRGFSFGFNSPKSKNYSRSGEKIREIESLNLREVSIVASPAYPDTTLTVMRNEDFIEEVTETQAPVVEEKKEERAEEPKVEQKVEPKVEEKKKIDDTDYQLRFRFLSLTHKF